MFFKYLSALNTGFFALLASASVASSALAGEPTFLKATEAYRYDAVANDQTIAVTYHVADGYYLYRKRFEFSTDTAGVTLDPAVFPPGLPHSDEYFGEQEIFRGNFTVQVPYHRAASVADLALKLRLQGCADAGLCYPPQTWIAHLALPPVPAIRTAPTSPSGAIRPASGGLLGKLVRPATDQSPAAPAPEFLPAEQAFQPSATLQSSTVAVRVAIAPGYYLYRERMHFKVAAPTTLGAPQWPASEIHHDEYFGDQAVFRGDVEVRIPYTGPAPSRIQLTYQGCADAGLCYTPQTTDMALGPVTAAGPVAGAGSAGAEQDRLATIVRTAHWWVVLASFWFFGLLLAFTPCVLPMVPILAGIIAGDGPRVSHGRGFALSLAYVGGMAVTYTTVGVAFAAVGAQSQAFFQQPWIIALFAALFVALALAMFGLYELALPSSWQTRFADLSGRIRGGRLASTALLGALSSLIVTACVAPPLVATFVVIGQVGAIGRGALALGALSLGMGTPLLLVGASAGRLLPKSGPWMETVKALFGVVFLGVAVWMLDRLVAAQVTMVGWAGVLAAAAAVLARVGRRAGSRSTARNVAVFFCGAYAVVLLISGLMGGTDPLHPTRGTRWGEAKAQSLPFRAIHSSAELDQAIAEAATSGRPVMLDFSADWCVSCKEMDAHTFNDPRVAAALGRYLILRADVTANSADDQALLRRFEIFGPPTTAFIKADGAERRAFRLVGFVDADQFLQHLTAFEAAP